MTENNVAEGGIEPPIPLCLSVVTHRPALSLLENPAIFTDGRTRYKLLRKIQIPYVFLLNSLCVNPGL